MTNDNLDNDFLTFNLPGKLRKISALLLNDSTKIYSGIFNNIEQRSYDLLSLILKNGPQSIKNISFSLNITHPAAVQIVNKLIKKKLVIKYDLPEDKRVTIIKITDKGIDVVNKLSLTVSKIDQLYQDLINEVDPKIIVTLNMIEEKLKSKSLVDRYKEKQKDEQIKKVKIVRYIPDYKSDFKRLNTEWLEKYFEVEKEDKKALDDPESYYIKNGGEIFFAILEHEVCGTCAMKRISRDIYELSKMAVSKNYQGKQIGKKLALTAIGFAYEKGAQKIVLETSPKLNAAINLYKKLGFEILSELERTIYKRALFKMELKLK